MQKFKRTNESLSSIVKGLDICPDDCVLAVGGSGDQAFALLEYAKKVVAVDIKQSQVSFIEQQAKSLAKGDYESFFMRRFDSGLHTFEDLIYVEKICGTNYFDAEKLEKIHGKMRSFRVIEGDVLDICGKNFNKIYLSNALKGSRNELMGKLEKIGESLPEGGLAYAANGRILKYALHRSGLVIDEKLSSASMDVNWNPIVLRKT
jgi:SAM-dependent methyltransferase